MMAVESLTSLVSTHSRLKAAGQYAEYLLSHQTVSTHSRLKAAGRMSIGYLSPDWGFNTQPPEGGW